MQSLLRRTATLSLSSLARPVSTPVRTLATMVVDAPFDPPTTRSRPASYANASVPLPNNPRVIIPKPKQSSAKAPRYSRHSSRVTGRTARKPRKALSPTALKLEGATTLGEREPSTFGEIEVFLPSVFVRLVRNSGEHRADPYVATFRTSLQLTKPDISNYLKNVYGLHITSIRTINYLSKLKRNPIGGGYSRAGGTKNYKKVVVTMTEPFWYPEERSRAWCNEHFERDRMEEMRDRKMLKIGDGQKYGVGAQRYRGAHKSKADRERLKAVQQAGGHDTVAAAIEGDSAALRRPTGLKKRKNVMRSREEAVTDRREAIEQEMQKLREAGW
ncbi:mitochondrial 54S ribosomal protein uL23m MRP20 [Sporobolomyces koalae]|uniref:mitochondrial 54S ribosomal protein uL23m MRP20 n=1 Tax=Sporobolomyces koalae TaxID=500713 RepID=UPI00317F4591